MVHVILGIDVLIFVFFAYVACYEAIGTAHVFTLCAKPQVGMLGTIRFSATTADGATLVTYWVGAPTVFVHTLDQTHGTNLRVAHWTLLHTALAVTVRIVLISSFFAMLHLALGSGFDRRTTQCFAGIASVAWNVVAHDGRQVFFHSCPSL